MSERQRQIGHEAHVFITFVQAFASMADGSDEESFRLWAQVYAPQIPAARHGEESARYCGAALVAWQLVRQLAEHEYRSVAEVLDELDQQIFARANEPDDE